MTLRDDPAWRAMLARLDAMAEADRIAEAQRWQQLSDTEKWAEMAGAVRRWRARVQPVSLSRLIGNEMEM